MGDHFADSWFSYMGSAVTDRDRSGHCHGGCHLALLLSFYVIVLSMAVAGIAGLLGVIPFFVTQNVPAALFMLGAAFAGIGLAILFIVAVKPVTIGIFKLYKASVNGIKRMFVKER